jgi:hypothetical protein
MMHNHPPETAHVLVRALIGALEDEEGVDGYEVKPDKQAIVVGMTDWTTSAPCATRTYLIAIHELHEGEAPPSPELSAEMDERVKSALRDNQF